MWLSFFPLHGYLASRFALGFFFSPLLVLKEVSYWCSDRTSFLLGRRPLSQFFQLTLQYKLASFADFFTSPFVARNSAEPLIGGLFFFFFFFFFFFLGFFFFPFSSLWFLVVRACVISNHGINKCPARLRKLFVFVCPRS